MKHYYLNVRTKTNKLYSNGLCYTRPISEKDKEEFKIYILSNFGIKEKQIKEIFIQEIGKD